MAAESRVTADMPFRLLERESISSQVAIMSDMHIGAKHDPLRPDHAPLMSGSDFKEDCERLAAGGQIHFVVYNGDILDKEADLKAVQDVEAGLRILAAAGINVLYVIGNNEDRIIQRSEPKRLFSKDIDDIAGIQVVQDGYVVREYQDRQGQTRKVAFVVAARVLPMDVHAGIWKQQGKSWVKKALEQRAELNKQVHTFEDNLNAAVEEGADEIFVVHHAPEEPTLYQEFHNAVVAGEITDEDYEALATTDAYTQATMRFHEEHNGIVAGIIIGHVEGGQRNYFLPVAGRESIPVFNACSVVLGQQASSISRPIALDLVA